MSTEVTPDLLRRVAAAWEGSTASDDYARSQMRAWADRLEREQRPLPEKPGWYPTIVVERGGESCTGALLTDNDIWITSLGVDECRHTHFLNDDRVTIRWAEQDGTTPGQTAFNAVVGTGTWSTVHQSVRDAYEREAAAVLAAHGTPTLTDDDRSEEFHQGWLAGNDRVKAGPPTLTSVNEHPEPGTRGLLPLVAERYGWLRDDGAYACMTDSEASRTILADPRPGGAW